MSNEIANKPQELKLVDLVQGRIREYQSKGEIFFPKNYSPENALKSAWLKLQEIEKDGKKALEFCTKESVANALLSLVVQGLNVDKNQAYFIPYGNKLVLQRSYMGTMAVAKTVDSNIDEIVAQVVYKQDEFKISMVNGKKTISHDTSIENMKSEDIIGAYAIVIYHSGKTTSEFMTIDQIKQSWKQSKMNPIDDKGNIKTNSVHGKFAEEMCKKTVINKVCKPIINSSNDNGLLLKYAKESEMELVDAEVEAEIQENANSIEVEVSKVDVETGEIIESAGF